MSPVRPRPRTSALRMTRTGLGGGGRLVERRVLLAAPQLHFPGEHRRRDGEDAHDRESADDREQRLDDAEETGTGVAVAHVLSLFFRPAALRPWGPCPIGGPSPRVRNLSTVSRTSPRRSPRSRSAVAMSRLS